MLLSCHRTNSQPVTDNTLVPPTANTNDGARLDVSARSFWITGWKAFFDIRVFDNTSLYQSKSFEQCFGVNEREKKRLDNRRTLEVEHASFTQLTFTTSTIHAAMGIECKTFVSKLGELLTIKRDLPKATMASWMGTKISFTLIRLMLICFRCSSLIKSSTMAISDIDVLENLNKNQREHWITHWDKLFIGITKIKNYIYIYEKKMVTWYFRACSQVITIITIIIIKLLKKSFRISGSDFDLILSCLSNGQLQVVWMGILCYNIPLMMVFLKAPYLVLSSKIATYANKK